jgi:hypothetical protein
MGRILIAALVGGIAVLLWGVVAHVVLPLGEVGVRPLPAEESMVGPMRTALTEPGVYFFPAMEMGRELSEEEKAAWEAKYLQGPTGILVYQPSGSEALSPRHMLIELLTDVVSALLAAILLSLTAVRYWARVLFVVGMGVFSWVTISIPYWNWYRFPGDFTLAEGIDQVLAWLVAGLVVAAIVKPRAAPTAAG